MNRIEERLAARLNERTEAGNLRQLPPQRAAVDFFSNDYLGLATQGILAEALQLLPQGACGTGATGSRLLSGNSREAEELEAEIATFHRAEAALLFNSGYNANTGLLAAIADRHTTILYDELCHASLLDGIRLSLCHHKYRFAHNNTDSLKELLRRHTALGPVVVVAESVYSMDGDMAPLAAMAALCATHNAQLVIDEAHATGVFGPHGEGLVCALGLEDRVFARIHTFGKALGCHGAAVVGSALLRQFLINFARPFIYTTALPPHGIQAARCAYRHMAAQAFSNAPLHALIAGFRAQVQATGATGWIDSLSPIQALVTGGNAHTRSIATRLQQAGLQVCAILSPTVPVGMERLRICLHTFNTEAELEMLIEGVKEMGGAEHAR